MTSIFKVEYEECANSILLIIQEGLFFSFYGMYGNHEKKLR